MNYDKWLEECPLTVWMGDKGLNKSVVASLAMTSVSTVSYWCTGANRPSPPSFKQLARIMSRDREMLEVVWAEWLSLRKNLEVEID